MEDLCRTSTTVSFTLNQLEHSPPNGDNVNGHHVIPVTGPLSELQIAYVCRETLQVIAVCFRTYLQAGTFRLNYSTLDCSLQGLGYLHSMGKMHRDIKVLLCCSVLPHFSLFNTVYPRNLKSGEDFPPLRCVGRTHQKGVTVTIC